MNYITSLSGSILCVLLAVATAVSADLAQIAPQLPIARMGHYGVALSDGTVALVGGHGTGFSSLAQVDQFSPATGTYASAQLQSQHDAAAVVRLPHDQLLVMGGSSALGVPAYNLAEVYDPHTLTVLASAHLQKLRAGSKAAVLAGGKVLLAGGWWTQSDAYRYAELVDPATLTSTLSGPLSQARSHPYVLPMADGSALVVGGLTQTGGSIPPSPERFDPTTGNFESFPVALFNEHPTLRFNASDFGRDIGDARLADGRYVLLGQEGTASSVTDTGIASILVPTERITNATTAPIWQCVVNAKQGWVHVIALDYPAGLAQGRIVVVTYDTNGNCVGNETTELMPLGYYLGWSSTTLLNDGGIFVAGGTSSDNFHPVTNALILRPQPQGVLSVHMSDRFPTLAFRGVLGATYELQWTSGLANSWIPLAEILMATSAQTYVDVTANGAQRFYRAVRK